MIKMKHISKKTSITTSIKETETFVPKKRIKRKLILSRVFSLVFLLMFVVSFFMSIQAFAEVLPFNITSVTISDKSEGVTENITDISNDEISNNITFHKLNDYVVYKVKVKSNLKKEITILSIIDNNDSEYIEYQYDKSENKKVLPESTFELVVKAIYKSELNDVSKRNQTNKVKFTIKYLEDGEEQEGTIIINPNTGDSIHISYMLLFVSSFGFIVCLALDKKRRNKKLSKVTAFIITGLILSPLAVKASTIAFNMTLKSKVGLYDKMIVTYAVDEKINMVPLPYGEKIELEDPNKEGYIFKEWKLEDGSDLESDLVLTEDIKLVPVFEKIESDITINVSDENSETPYKKVSIGVDLKNIESDKVITKYSLDNGKTWITYTKEFYVEENITINVKTMINDSNKVIGESKKQINNIVSGTSDLLDAGSVYDIQYTFGEYEGQVDEITLIKCASIEKYESVKNTLDKNNIVSVDKSEYPTYMWLEDDEEELILYYYSAAQVIYLNRDSSNLYAFFSNLKEIDFSKIDTSKVEDMGRMFMNDEELENLDLSSFDTSKVTNMKEMFSFSIKLSSLNISSFDTSKVEDMSSMFEQTALTTLDLSSFDTSNVKNMSSMFKSSSKLKTIYVSTAFTTDSLTSNLSSNMFRGCNKLVGGNGTNYKSTNVNGDYAIIDGLDNKPGYFTEKNKVERYLIGLNPNKEEYEFSYKSVVKGEEIGKLSELESLDYFFDGWYFGDILIDENYVPNDNITLRGEWTKKEIYEITYDYNDGNTSTFNVHEKNNIGKLDEPEKEGYIFDGWYLEQEFENKVTANYVPTESITIYAKWDEKDTGEHEDNICPLNRNLEVSEGIVCKRAIELHQEVCPLTGGTRDSYGCVNAGYTVDGSKGTDIVTYGNCGEEGTLTSGDAFTCDVNGDGFFDKQEERFYYVSDYYNTNTKSFESDTATLIYYNNITDGGIPNTTSKYSYNKDNINYLGPTTLISHLPTISNWSNISLKNNKRAILADSIDVHDQNEISSELSLPTEFDYTGYAARILTIKELTRGCNANNIVEVSTGSFDNCSFLFENTQYAFNNSSYVSGLWLETPFYGGSGVWNYEPLNRTLFRISANSMYVGLRPVIDVPKNKMSY